MFLHLIGDSEGNAPALVYDLIANDTIVSMIFVSMYVSR